MFRPPPVLLANVTSYLVGARSARSTRSLIFNHPLKAAVILVSLEQSVGIKDRYSKTTKFVSRRDKGNVRNKLHQSTLGKSGAKLKPKVAVNLRQEWQSTLGKSGSQINERVAGNLN